MAVAPSGPTPDSLCELRDRLEKHYGREGAPLNGWTLAEKVSAIGFETADKALKEEAVRLAARAVLRRACRMVGPLRLTKRKRTDMLREPFRGELDVGRTLDNMIGREPQDPRDWVMVSREEHERSVCLMMDVSLSMSGRNLALAALACAVLALKIPPGDLALVAFDSVAREVVPLGEAVPPEEVVRRILRLPARGYTNLHDALRLGWKALRGVQGGRRVGILVTDGVATVGEDPLALAAPFPVLHVLMTEDGKTNEPLCRKMARRGRGHLLRIQNFDEMPGCMLELAHRL